MQFDWPPSNVNWIEPDLIQKIYKIILKIDYVTRILSVLVTLSIEKHMLAKPKYKNLISKFAT